MPRYYMILVRKYVTGCECANRNDCTHPPLTPTDEWEPYVREGGVAVYGKPPSAQSVGNANRGYQYWTGETRNVGTGVWSYSSRIYKKTPKRDTRRVYFDTETLFEYTGDYQQDYEQKEARLDGLVEEIKVAAALAANPPPAPEPPAKKRRSRKKKVYDLIKCEHGSTPCDCPPEARL